MKWFYDMKIGSKLIISFILMVVITAVVGYMGIVNMSKINAMADKLYQNELLGVSYIKEANINLIYFGRAERNVLLSSSAEQRGKYLDNLKKYKQQFVEYLEKAKPLFQSEEGKAGLAKVQQAWDDYERVHNKTMDLANSEEMAKERESVSLCLGEAREKAGILDETLTSLTQHKEENGKMASEETTALYRQSRTFMIILIFASMLIGIGLGMFISRVISLPLIKAMNFARAIAAGDLSHHMDMDRKDETGQLVAVMNEMNQKLQEIVSEVKSAANNVASGSQEMSTTAEEMSQGASEQASAAEEVSSSMEEMVSNIKQNAENAQQTERIALKSAGDAKEGGSAVGATVSAMKDIAGKISIIEEIARQTNLLALNAAIEADLPETK